MIRDYIKGAIESKKGDDKKEVVGIGEFTAYVSIDESTSYTADIPEEVLEDGSMAQTDIIIRPISIKITGEVGDVVLKPDPITLLQNRINSELGRVTTYLPDRTQAQLSRMASLANDAQDRIRQIDQAIVDGRTAAAFFGVKGDTSDPPGKQFIDAMEALYFGKQTVSVATKHKVRKSMAIANMTVAHNNTDGGTQFSIDFKQVLTVEVKRVDIAEFFPNPAPQAQGKTGDTGEKGAQTGDEPPVGVAGWIVNQIRGGK